MEKTIEQIREELDSKIPRDAISEREAGYGKKLSYVEGWYIIDRLNKVLGIGNWQYEIESVTRVFESTIEKNGKTGRAVSYNAQIRLTAEIGNKVVSFSDIGSGKGIDYGNGLEADESAVKESVTDGVKRCAKNLGMSMGLALYDKTHENVEETPQEPQAHKAKEDAKPAERAKKLKPSNADASLDAIKKLIRQSAIVLEAQKKLTQTEFKSKFILSKGADKLDALNESSLNSILNELREEFPNLGV